MARLRDKIDMPKKRKMDEELDAELDLDLAEEDIEEDDLMEMDEESEASEMSPLEDFSDDELLAEARARGLMPEEDMDDDEEDPELIEEEEEPLA